MNATTARLHLAEYFGAVELDYMLTTPDAAEAAGAGFDAIADVWGPTEARRWFLEPCRDLGGWTPSEALHRGELAEFAVAARDRADG